MTNHYKLENVIFKSLLVLLAFSQILVNSHSTSGFHGGVQSHHHHHQHHGKSNHDDNLKEYGVRGNRRRHRSHSHRKHLHAKHFQNLCGGGAGSGINNGDGDELSANCPPLPVPIYPAMEESSPCSWTCTSQSRSESSGESNLQFLEGPVCGSNGLIYDSRCTLQKEACLLKKLRRLHNRLETSADTIDQSPAPPPLKIDDEEDDDLTVDETGRNCVHFRDEPMLNLSLNTMQNDDSRRRKEGNEDGEGTVPASSDSHSENPSSKTISPNEEIHEEERRNRDSFKNILSMTTTQDINSVRKCSKDQFEQFKEKLFDLGEAKWKELTRAWNSQSERQNGAKTKEKELAVGRWKRLLADGPEADKDHLIQLIFSSLDLDSNFVLNYPELYKTDLEFELVKLDLGLTSTSISPSSDTPSPSPCQWRDFLLYQDTDGDDRIHVVEFYTAFSHLYGVTMISLEKALEWKRLEVVQGSDVLLLCDVVGSPPAQIIWTTPSHQIYPQTFQEASSSTSNPTDDDPHIRQDVDGSLIILGVAKKHQGNYTCMSTRNEEVVQTQSVVVVEDNSQRETSSYKPVNIVISRPDFTDHYFDDSVL